MKVIAPKRLMRNLSPIVRNGDIFNQASLDLEFARTRTLDKRVTHTRASNATYVDGDGIIQTAGINVPRFDHNPTTGESLGLLVEESRENLVDYSEDLSSWSGAGTKNLDAAVTDPAGNTGTVYYPSISEAYKTFDANGASQIAVSCFVKQRSGETNNTQIQIFQSVSGTVVFLGAVDLPIAGTFAPTGAFSNGTRTEYPNGWYRFTFLVNADAGQGTGTFTNAGRIDIEGGVSTNYVWGVQVENASFPTSYIRTEGSTVTRSADVTSIEGNDFGTFNLVKYSEVLNESLTAFWEERGTFETRFDSSALSPTNTAGVWYLTNGSSVSYDNTFRTKNIPVNTSTTYTFSIYAKARNNETGFIIRLLDLAGTSVVENKTINSNWQRFTTTITTSGTAANALVLIGLDSASDEVYFWGAQLEQSSTATPYVKSDVTWTSRASNATYYDYTGTLRKSSYNQLVYSEEFDRNAGSTTEWGHGPDITVTANDREAPNGTLTADKIVQSGSGSYLFQSRTVGTIASTSFTASLYVYAESEFDFTIRVRGNGSTQEAENFTVSTVANQWTRVSVTKAFTASADGTTAVVSLYTDVIGQSNNRTVWFWGAQLETGPYAGDYAKTEGSAASSARNVAFLPDGSGNFVSAGELLLEESRTNFVLNSDNADPANKLNITTSLETIVDPTGNSSSVRKCQIDGDSPSPTAFSIRWGNTSSGDSSSPYSGSVWVKTASGTVGITADINDGTAESFTVNETWQRITVSRAATGNAWEFLDIRVDDGQTGSSFYVWGVQIEKGAYPTSYIPTYGSTATRAADVSSSSSNTFGNSFYNQDAVTAYVDGISNARSEATSRRSVSISDGSGNNRLILYTSTSGQDSRTLLTTGGAGQASNLEAGVFPEFRTIFAADNVSANSSFNGSTETEDTSLTLPSVMDRLYVGLGEFGATNAAAHTGTISRIAIWSTRLSNDTLKTITA